MSGGSYSNLYFQVQCEGQIDREILERMAERLGELGHKDAEARIAEALSTLDGMADIFKAVEWYDSSDWPISSVTKAIEEWRER